LDFFFENKLRWQFEVEKSLPTAIWGTLQVAQLVEALRYKPEGHGFDFRWCHWNFSLTQSFRPHYGPGVDSALTEMSTRNVSWG
jgi:hypothetical protein